MELLLVRHYKGHTCTIGSLYLNGTFECYTLEDVVRQVNGEPTESWKIKGQTAIPTGRYEVTITFSSRFKILLPLLLDVPGFEAIRIHSGNTDADTEGCILVGRVKADEYIFESKLALEPLLKKIQDCIASGEKVFITVA
jgi:hypothetical protein